MSAAHAVPAQDPGLEEIQDSANERFKNSFGSWFWGSLIAATVLHFVIFQFWPAMEADNVNFTNEVLETIELPDEIEIPPPPKKITRPATPVISDVEIDETITILETTFEENRPQDLPPPPEAKAGDIGDAPTIVPMTTRPAVKNTAEVLRALQREYPPMLKDAGIGGTVIMWFLLSEEGDIIKFQIEKRSKHKQFDVAAMKVAPIFKFSPASNQLKKIRVWVQQAITFKPLR